VIGLVNIGTLFALSSLICAEPATFGWFTSDQKKMREARSTPTQWNGRHPHRDQSVSLCANLWPILRPFSFANRRDMTFSTCSRSLRSVHFPPRRGGAQAVFAAAHDRHGTASDLMHTVHKMHNENDEFARLTRSAAAVCDRIAAAQEYAPHMHNWLAHLHFVLRHGSTNPCSAS